MGTEIDSEEVPLENGASLFKEIISANEHDEAERRKTGNELHGALGTGDVGRVYSCSCMAVVV